MAVQKVVGDNTNNGGDNQKTKKLSKLVQNK